MDVLERDFNRDHPLRPAVQFLHAIFTVAFIHANHSLCRRARFFALAWVFIKKKQNVQTGKILLRVAFVATGIILISALRPLVANHDITASIVFLLAGLGLFYLVAIGGLAYSFTKKNG